MCVNDLVVQGAEPLFFLDYFATGKLDVEAATDVIKGIAEGLQTSQLRPDRWRNCRNAGHVCQIRIMIWQASLSARQSAELCSHAKSRKAMC